MPPLIQNPRARLLRERGLILDRMSEVAPDLVAEFRANEAALEALDVKPGTRYAKIRGTKAAAVACLEHEGEWLTRREIAQKLYEGGFEMDPKRGFILVMDALGHNVARGNFQEVDGKVGLNEWKPMRRVEK